MNNVRSNLDKMGNGYTGLAYLVISKDANHSGLFRNFTYGKSLSFVVVITVPSV